MVALVIYLGLGLYLFWLLFLSCMALKWRWQVLSKPVKAASLPAVVVVGIVDIVFNLTLGSLIFWDRPRQWTFSQRVSRYKGLSDWRAPVARWICSNLLDPFEVGGHCKGE